MARSRVLALSRCMALALGAACWLCTASPPAHGQAYFSSRYAEPAGRASLNSPTLYDASSGVSSLSGGSGRCSPYDDYRLADSGHTQFDQSFAPEASSCPTPEQVFDDPGPQGDVWSPPVPAPTRLFFRPGVIALRRGDFNSQAFTDGATPTNADDLKTGTNMGPQGTFLYRGLFGRCLDLEISYFHVDGFDATAFTPIASQLFTVPSINFAPMDVTSYFDSSVTSGEINLRRGCTDWVTPVIGFRYFRVEDDLLHKICLTGMNERIRTENRAYGFQIGFDGPVFIWGRFELGGWAKAAVLANDVSQQTTVTLVPGTIPSISDSGVRAAYLADLGLSMSFQIFDWFAVRGGYQVLWFEGAVTAPSQMLSTNVVTGSSTVNTDNRLFFHGAFAGAELSW